MLSVEFLVFSWGGRRRNFVYHTAGADKQSKTGKAAATCNRLSINDLSMTVKTGSNVTPDYQQFTQIKLKQGTQKLIHIFSANFL